MISFWTGATIVPTLSALLNAKFGGVMGNKSTLLRIIPHGITTPDQEFFSAGVVTGKRSTKYWGFAMGLAATDKIRGADQWLGSCTSEADVRN